MQNTPMSLLKQFFLLNTEQIYAKFESELSLAKIIEVTIESSPIGFKLGKDTCICKPDLNSSSINCDLILKI